MVEGISHVDQDEGDSPIPQEEGSFYPSEAASNYDDADRVIHGELRSHSESRSSTLNGKERDPRCGIVAYARLLADLGHWLRLLLQEP